MRVRVLDADHPAGAIGDRLGEAEQVGAGVVLRIAAVAFDKRLRTGLSDERLAEFAEVLAALRANVEAPGFARLPASFPGDEDDQLARSRQRASAIKS